jgi:antibiotic biosynthesis monooxygenase (ABM) superfamily enzyme
LKQETDSSSTIESGATAVISHRVLDGQQTGYEDWLNEIGPICRSYAGHLDLQIVHPIAGLTTTYTVIIRFDTHQHLEAWMGSGDRKRLIDKARPLLAKDDDFFIRSGLDFWFTPEGAKAKVPVRWKQFIVTWSAIYPLVLGVQLIVEPLLRLLGIPRNHYIDTLCVTCTVVSLMVYFVMPRYTRLIRHWLFT